MLFNLTFFIRLVVVGVRYEVCANSKLHDTLQVPRLVLCGQWVTSSGEMMTIQFISVGYVAPPSVIN